MRSVIGYTDSLKWVKNLPIGKTNIRCVWVTDTKDGNNQYWRQSWLNDNGYRIQYKGGRKPKSDTYHLAKQAFYQQVRAFPRMIVYGETGFEADDMVAKMVREASPNDYICMVTVDTDWIGLVSDRVSWVNIHGRWRPRFRNNIQSINEWASRCKALNKQTLDYPAQIWDIKSKDGDKSDNLPSGSPIGVISLLNPALSPVSSVPTQYGSSMTRGHANKLERNLTRAGLIMTTPIAPMDFNLVFPEPLNLEPAS